MKALKVATIILLFQLATGCAAPTSIVSNKANDYVGAPKRVFVMSDVGSEFGQEFFDAFAVKLTSILHDCGSELEISRISPLELDESAQTRKIQAFNSDAILTIKQNGGTKDQYGMVIHAIYDAKLIDVRSDKLVWRAQTNFYRGGTLIPIADRGTTLAIDITNKLKQDAIFTTCEIIQTKK